MGTARLKVKEVMKPLVLVVDDEESICSSLCSVLEDESYITICAGNGQEALQQVIEHKPELIFLDMWMPGWDGVETLERIKQVAPDTEVIMISGHATIANALEATRRGAFDFIEKPFDIDSVVFAASRALERKHAKRKNHKDKNGDIKNDDAVIKSSLLHHEGVLSVGLKGKNVGQRTIARSAILYGQCLHSGQKSGLVLEPLPLNSGIHFAKIGETRPTPAFIDYVNSTSFATTVGAGREAVSTIEHLLSVLHAYKISNLLIKCNDEVPIFDGSGNEICSIFDNIGLEEQGGDWHEIAVEQPVEYKTGKVTLGVEESLRLEPSTKTGFTVYYELNYPPPIGKQVYEFNMSSVKEFKNQIAPARTFGFMKDVEKLQKAGLAAGGRLNNFILIGADGIVNTELRFPEELARHKILDAIGDLFLLGRPLQGRLVARMTGHSDNVRLVSKLRKLAIG